MIETMFEDVLLPHLDPDVIIDAYRSAPGNELASGKMRSAESSAALVANGFGLFLTEPERLPKLPGLAAAWPARSVALEGIVRFPWSGGRHPCLDVLVETDDALVGIESKRYEPFRTKSRAGLSEAYWRPVWGERMTGFERVRDNLRDGTLHHDCLDAAQLVKHAFGLRTAAARSGKRAVLLYLHCEPSAWPDGRSVSAAMHALHRSEVDDFRTAVTDNDVVFIDMTWRHILETWSASEDVDLRRHAAAMIERFMV